jgi:hypothetical protein
MTSADRDALDALLRTQFKAFFQLCFLTLNPGATYMPNWLYSSAVTSVLCCNLHGINVYSPTPVFCDSRKLRS